MAPRYFSVEEANALLPKIEPMMGALLERRAKVVRMRQEMGEVLEDLHQNFGGGVASEMVREFIAIDELALKIQSYGCVLKDMNAGLIDFLAERDGREVYLCWRYGEPRVAFFHELHTGYNGRQPV